jgi:outer membrane lipoprotein SlyB
MTLKKCAAVAVALLLSLAVVGCGSKKDDSASTGAAADAEKQSQDNGDNSTTTTGKSDKSTTTTAGSDGVAGLGDLANGELGDCLGTSLAYASLIIAPLGFTGGATQEQLDKFEQDTADLEAKIPSELKDDFDTVAKAYKEYGDTLKGIDFSDMTNADSLDKLTQASKALDSQDVKDAQDHIQEYFDSNCGK